MTTHGKESRIYRKSPNKQQTAIRNPGRRYDQSCHVVLFKRSSFQQKIMGHAKNTRKNVPYKGGGQSIETIS